MLPDRRSSKTWAVSAYYNPAGYRSRRQNYDAFRSHLSIPLLTVEFSPHHQFELRADNADILVQCAQGDILWQKEAMLRLGITRLPSTCENVVLVDCDIVFVDASWLVALEQALERFMPVQPFLSVVDLSAQQTRQIREEGRLPPYADLRSKSSSHQDGYEGIRTSLAKAWTTEPMTDAYWWSQEHKDAAGLAPGFALAAKRELFAKSPIFDQAIIGGGDSLLWAAVAQQAEKFADVHHVHGNFRKRYLKWSRHFNAAINQDCGFVDCPCYHLWHGRLENRRYEKRALALHRLGFDPERDLWRSAEGLWKWAAQRTDLHDFAREYFALRHEDEAFDDADVTPTGTRFGMQP